MTHSTPLHANTQRHDDAYAYDVYDVNPVIEDVSDYMATIISLLKLEF